jgi:hypothetical protein
MPPKAGQGNDAHEAPSKPKFGKLKMAARSSLAAGMGKQLAAKALRTAQKGFEPLPDKLKLKTFILKHWTSSFIHAAGHLPTCYHTHKSVHAKYCNGLFIHYKTAEGVLHGEFKQTYVTTIEFVLDLIKLLAGVRVYMGVVYLL